MQKKYLTLVLLLVLFGGINTIILKLQNIQIINTSTRQQFFHPFMQAIFMFIGEVLVGVVYLIRRGKFKEEKNKSIFQDKKKAPNWIVIFPAFMDLMSTLLSYTALNMVASSVWQISRGGNIIGVAVLSYFFLKRKFQNIAIVGCVLAFLGITGVQVVSVFFSDESSDQGTTSQIIGVILLLASIIFNSCGLVIEKWIFNKYEINPLKMVFLEGFYGLIVLLPLTFSFQYIKCPWENHNSCVRVGNQYYLESISGYFNDLGDSLLLIFLNIGLVVSISISVPIAVSLSKSISPVSRSLADVCRTLLIWIFGIIMTLTVGKNKQEYKLEDTGILINLLKALGFSILIFGTMLYHDLLPCFVKKRRPIVDSMIDSSMESESEEPFIVERLESR